MVLAGQRHGPPPAWVPVSRPYHLDGRESPSLFSQLLTDAPASSPASPGSAPLLDRARPALPRGLPADPDESHTLHPPSPALSLLCSPERTDPTLRHSSPYGPLASVSWGLQIGCFPPVTSCAVATWQNPTFPSMAHISPPLGSLPRALGNSQSCPGLIPTDPGPTVGTGLALLSLGERGELSGTPVVGHKPSVAPRAMVNPIQAPWRALHDTVGKTLPLKSQGVEKLRWCPKTGGQVPPVPCRPGR